MIQHKSQMISLRSMVLSWVNQFFSLRESFYFVYFSPVVFSSRTFLGTQIVADIPPASQRRHNQLTRMSDLLINLCFDVSMGTDIFLYPSVGFAIHMLYLLYFLNTLLCNIVTPCGHNASFCTFMISSLDFLKRLPWSGFVNISAAMLPVRQYTTLTSIFSIKFAFTKLEDQTGHSFPCSITQSDPNRAVLYN